jgi:putative heme-binding domain-containing protein
MPAFDFSAGDLSAITAYIRARFDPEGVAVLVGDPVRGQALFERKGNCSSCHRVNGVGQRTAPDLSDVGLRRTPANLQLNLVDPATALLPINRPVRLVTTNEEVITCRRLNEDTYSVQLIDSNGQLRSLLKENLTSYTVSEQPSKPPTTLNSDEVADVVAYLLNLRGIRTGVQ